MGLDYKKLGSIFKSIKESDSNLDYWLTPDRKATIGISKDIIIDFFQDLLLRLDREPTKVSIDIETRHNTVDCIGFSFDKTEGLVIPFSTLSNPNPWNFEDELVITLWMLKVLNHENLQIVGQNFSYDSQYLNKFYFINLHPHLDTMIANHVLYNYMPKDLSYLASIYCDTFSQWKDMQTHEVK
jgi:DNA polymerase I-like protein with 3'-5' exonuclease and polymerase domains